MPQFTLHLHRWIVCSLTILFPTCLRSANVASPSLPTHYDNRLGFSFTHLSLDHTQIDAVYFGLDLSMPYFFSQGRNEHYGQLYLAEVRIGYNLLYDNTDSITPLFGAGYQYNNVGDFHHAKFGYVKAGVRYYHEFNNVLGWGLFINGLVGQQLGGELPQKIAWGVDLSMPIGARFTSSRCWDIILEPFYLYMESAHIHQAVFGGRGTIGYRF